MSEPMPFAKIRLSLMFAAEHELPIELGTDEVWSVLNKLDQLSAETGKAIARAEAAERERDELRERTRWIPVSERLPEVIEQVLCYAPHYHSIEIRWTDQLGEAVTHWQPLPVPPEADHD